MNDLSYFLGEIRSMVDVDSKIVTEAMIVMAVNYGQLETYKQIISSYEGHFRTSKRQDIVADKDLYDYPDDLYKVTLIERLDLSDTPTELDQGTMYQRNVYAPASGISLDRTHYQKRFWCPINNKQFSIAPTPEAFAADGLRIWYLRKPKKLLLPEDVCEVPEEYQAMIILKAVDWLALKPGVQLANPEKHEATKAENNRSMIDSLSPIDELGYEPIVDDDPFYVG